MRWYCLYTPARSLRLLVYAWFAEKEFAKQETQVSRGFLVVWMIVAFGKSE